MASEDSELLYCYNNGCGSKFLAKDNKKDSCCFHPGSPVFHDAYKGWSCCNKKSINFNEFLNIKGCRRSFHSSVKPQEPKKVETPKAKEVYEYRPPESKVSTIERPSFDSPLTILKPSVSNSLKSQLESLSIQKTDAGDLGEIKIGTTCKNPGCKEEYGGPGAPRTDCVYHKGDPVFHEGLKFWSCCNRKTTDFAVFLGQAGCTVGQHVWLKEKPQSDQSNIRYDWHQTGTHVFISVYAKTCDPNRSVIQVNPIRVKMHLELLADGSCFDKDLELCGVVDVEQSGVSMMPTKVEVKLKKAEAGSWSKLYAPEPANEKRGNGSGETASEGGIANSGEDDVVDLKDIN